MKSLLSLLNPATLLSISSMIVSLSQTAVSYEITVFDFFYWYRNGSTGLDKNPPYLTTNSSSCTWVSSIGNIL